MKCRTAYLAIAIVVVAVLVIPIWIERLSNLVVASDELGPITHLGQRN